MRTYPRVRCATSFWSRLRGVGFNVTWGEFEALCLPRCRAVHTVGLSRPIDIVFVSVDGVILELRSRIPPWRFVTTFDSRVIDTWEFPAGTCEHYRATPGMLIDVLLQPSGS